MAINSSVEIASSYITPIEGARVSTVQTTVQTSTIDFSNLSACEKVKSVNGKSMTIASQYGSRLAQDLANFKAIAATFAATDAKIYQGD